MRWRVLAVRRAGHAQPSCPRSSRASTTCLARPDVVDARHKAGHDADRVKLLRASRLPAHLIDEERLVGRRLPLQLLAGTVDGVVLVEADARHVLAQDLEGLAVVLQPLLLVEDAAGGIDLLVEGGV